MFYVILVYSGIVCVCSVFPLRTRINSHIYTHWVFCLFFCFLLWLNHPVSETWSLHSQKEMFNLHPPTQIQILTAHSLSNGPETVFFGRQGSKEKRRNEAWLRPAPVLPSEPWWAHSHPLHRASAVNTKLRAGQYGTYLWANHGKEEGPSAHRIHCDSLG